jgi:NAD(P)-dependent dehydrogenase (short-subunit alcohol dehydrogenase family)
LPGERAGHALISGGSSGIGLALAHRLAEAGWDLTLMARDWSRLAAAQAAVALHGRAVDIRSVDVADEASVAAVVAAATARLGPPDLVVACAGIVVPGCFDAQPPSAFRRSMEVNYLGALHLVRAALSVMRPRGGRIVLVASGAALIGLYGYTSYAPTKFAVRGLAEALRSELAAEGIGVSVVYPPDTDTPGFREERRIRPAITSRLAGAGGLMTAEQVADAIMLGIARGHSVITPGASMTILRWLHSLIGPALHWFWFDPLIARAQRRQEHCEASVDRPGGRPDDAGMVESQGEVQCRRRSRICWRPRMLRCRGSRPKMPPP